MVAPVIIAAGITAAASLASSLMNKGNKEKKGKNTPLPLQTAEQKEMDKVIADYIKKGEGPLKDYFPKFNQSEFQQGVANPAIRKYQEDVLPQLLEKYNAGNQALGSGQLRAEVRGQTDLQSNLDQLQYQSQNQSDRDRSNAILQLLGIHQGKGNVENLYKQPGAPAPTTGQGIASGLANNSGDIVKAFMDYRNSQGQSNPSYSGSDYSNYTTQIDGASKSQVG